MKFVKKGCPGFVVLFPMLGDPEDPPPAYKPRCTYNQGLLQISSRTTFELFPALLLDIADEETKQHSNIQDVVLPANNFSDWISVNVLECL